MERRMDESTAEKIHTAATDLLFLLEEWQAAHPNVADYRVTQAIDHTRRTHTLTDYLLRDVDPEGDAARAALAKSPLFNR